MHPHGDCAILKKEYLFKSVAQSEKCVSICGHFVIMGDSKVAELSPDSDGAGTITEVEINERSLLRKIDAKLLPAVGILYLLSFLDRSNGESAIDALSSLTPSSWKCKD